MKLLFLSHTSDCSGGAQKCLLDLLKGIKQIYPDWQIFMVFPGAGDLVDACSSYLDGYTFLQMEWWLIGDEEHITLRKKVSYVCNLLKYSMKLVSYLKLIKPDYGITNTIVLPHLALSCKLLGVKHCWFIHEMPDLTWQNITPIFKYRFIYKVVDRFSDKILVTSECVKCHYRNLVANDKVSVINQAVDLPLMPDMNYAQKVRKRYTILLVGAFDSNKGQLELLQAVKKIIVEGRDIFCYLVGPDTGLMSVCQDFVKDNRLDGNVEIVPYVKEISSYYFKVDALLVCSAFETFGRVAVEAQMCGLPVILSNVGANPERIEDGKNGLLYQKNNIMDLVAKIEMLRDDITRNVFIENIDLDAVRKKYSTVRFASHFSRLLSE